MKLADILVTPLRRIETAGGDVFHAMKNNDAGYDGFGEAYFTTVNFDQIKGWKKHTKMTMNLIVPCGEIEFVIYDDREESKTKGDFCSVKLSTKNYQRLTVSPNLWVAFKGCSMGLNLILNIASIEHDPNESINVDLMEFPYEW